MPVKTYSQKGMTVSCGGVQAHGYTDGQFLKVTYVTPQWSDKAGTDGEVSRSPSADRRGMIELSLMQTSDYNDYLSAIHQAALATGGGVFGVLIRDRNGRTAFQADSCWIEAEPEATFDGVATVRVWKIKAAQLNSFQGGN